MVAGIIAEYMMAAEPAPSGQVVFESSYPANTTGNWNGGLNSGSTSQYQITTTSVTNGLLVVGVAFGYLPNTGLANVTVTFGGQTLTRLDSQQTAAPAWDLGGCVLYYLKNPPVQTSNVAINMNTQGATGVSALSGSLLFSGVDQTTPFVSTKKDTTATLGSYPSYTNTISSSVTNMIIGIGCSGANIGNVSSTGSNTRFVWAHDLNTTSGNYVIGTWPGASTVTAGFSFNVGTPDVYGLILADIKAA